MVARPKKMQTYGLLGRNISYSLSPDMQNAAFRHFGISAGYKVFDVEENKLDKFFKEVVFGGGVSGINVTIPYKIKVRDILASKSGCKIDDNASILGAVNTVKIAGADVTGFNTDGMGFYEALKEDTGFVAKDKNIFIFGAGGAGRAICLFLAALKEDRPKMIFVNDVDKAKCDSLIADCEKNFGAGIAVPVEERDIPWRMSESSLVVNATPLGTKAKDPLPIPVGNLRTDMVVYDLVYAHETPLVKCARDMGLVAADGLGMLVSQGAIAFNIWTGESVKEARKVMRNAVRRKLKGAK